MVKNRGIQHILVLLRPVPKPQEEINDQADDSTILVRPPAKLFVNDEYFSEPLMAVHPDQKILVKNVSQQDMTIRFRTSRGFSEQRIGTRQTIEYVPDSKAGAFIELDSPQGIWLHSLVVLWKWPYHQSSRWNGKFHFNDLPVGKYEVICLHNRGQICQVELDGKPQQWKAGRFHTEIKPEENELGEILVAPSNFGLDDNQ